MIRLERKMEKMQEEVNKMGEIKLKRKKKI